MYKLFLLLFCSLIGSLGALEKVQLQYLPNVPVTQTWTTVLDIEQSLPGFKLNGTTEQSIDALLTIPDEGSEFLFTKGPLSLLFTLKDFKVHIRANDASASFNSSHPSSEMFQLSKWLDQQVLLNFDESLQLDKSKELQVFLSQLPAMGAFFSENTLGDLFQPLFALAGRSLAVGAQFPIKRETGEIVYEIVDINDREIVASMTGSITPKELCFQGEMSPDSKKEEKVTCLLKGKMKGEIVWSRQNALLYSLQSQYQYTGTFKVRDWTWNMNLRLSHAVDSQF